MNEIIFKRFLNKEGDSYLHYYHIQDNKLYYENKLLAINNDEDIIEINTNISSQNQLKDLLIFLKKENINEDKLNFYKPFNYDNFDLYFEVITNYLYCYKREEFKDTYDFLEILYSIAKKDNNLYLLDNVADSIGRCEIKGLNISRKIKVAKMFKNEKIK